MDDERLAKASRALRRQGALRQEDLPTSRFVTQEIEAGRAGRLKLDAVRAHFAALGAKSWLTVWWNGAALDRLLDERHAQVVDATVATLLQFAFRTKAEHTFNEFGERGSIDIFAGHERERAVVVGEAKSEWGSLEETLRRQDVKVRLAPQLAEHAFGWRPVALASLLVFPDVSTNRRVAERYVAALAGYPARGREIRRWLRKPVGPLAGLWFLSDAGLGRRGNDLAASI